eukprot:gnl/Chilomastix_caulleri/1386.p1 GENE.gnl/Chilomastix_caulleri/1386~~gnl/Chilomastix_caulleri/1386.p1  ORF type:complete len:106 (+),score=7.26 gnl/Chilomastix_caulleri/1386:47-364(+)
MPNGSHPNEPNRRRRADDCSDFQPLMKKREPKVEEGTKGFNNVNRGNNIGTRPKRSGSLIKSGNKLEECYTELSKTTYVAAVPERFRKVLMGKRSKNHLNYPKWI